MFMYILSVEGYGQIHPARPCSHDFMENFGSGLCAEGAHAATVRLHRGSADSDGAGDPLALDPGTSEKEPEARGSQGQSRAARSSQGKLWSEDSNSMMTAL